MSLPWHNSSKSFEASSRLLVLIPFAWQNWDAWSFWLPQSLLGQICQPWSNLYKLILEFSLIDGVWYIQSYNVKPLPRLLGSGTSKILSKSELLDKLILDCVIFVCHFSQIFICPIFQSACCHSSCHLNGFFLFIVVMSGAGPTPWRLIPRVLRALACNMSHLLTLVALDIVKIEMCTALEESSPRPHWWAASSSLSVLIPSFSIVFHWASVAAGSALMFANRARVQSMSIASGCLEGAKKGRWPPAFCDLNLSRLHLTFMWNQSPCLLSAAVLHCSNVLRLLCWKIVS